MKHSADVKPMKPILRFQLKYFQWNDNIGYILFSCWKYFQWDANILLISALPWHYFYYLCIKKFGSILAKYHLLNNEPRYCQNIFDTRGPPPLRHWSKTSEIIIKRNQNSTDNFNIRWVVINHDWKKLREMQYII